MDSFLPRKQIPDLLRIPPGQPTKDQGKAIIRLHSAKAVMKIPVESSATLYVLSEQCKKLDSELKAKLRTYLAEKEGKRSAALDHEARAVKKQREVKAIDKHFGALYISK